MTAGDWPAEILVCPDCGLVEGDNWRCGLTRCRLTDPDVTVQPPPFGQERRDWISVEVVPLADVLALIRKQRLTGRPTAGESYNAALDDAAGAVADNYKTKEPNE